MATTKTVRKAKAKPTAGEVREIVIERVVEKPVILDRAVLEKRMGSLADPVTHSVDDAAANLVQKERISYDDANRKIKETIRRAYKNYLGVFDEPYDPYTNRKKVFTPLTHNVVDAVAKGVSVSSSSIRIKPLTDESRGAAKILNMVLPYFFQQAGFDQMMKHLVHRTAWMGTQVTVQDWLYRETESAHGMEPDTKEMADVPGYEKPKTKTKKVVEDRPRITLVNVMDVFVPDRAESLSWAVKNASVILRSQMPLSAVESNPRYKDAARAKIKGFYARTQDDNDSTSLSQYAQSGYSNEARTTGGLPADSKAMPDVTVYSRFGKVPKSWITGKESDALTQVDGIIECASDSSSGTNMVTLCVRLSPFGEYGPFEDCRFNVIPERYFGEGVGERLIPLQAWQNEVVNIRRNNEVLVQHRMYKYRKGSVDTRQFFARPGGGIAVENMDDVQPLDVGDVKQSSFVEDQNIEAMAQRLAGAATTPVQKKMTATESAGVQNQQMMTYNELKDTVEKYVERLVLKHIIPMLKRYFKAKRAIPVEIPFGELEVLDTYNGYSPFQSKLLGPERFLLIDSTDAFDGEFAVTVEIEDAAMGRMAKANALLALVSAASKLEDSGMDMQAAFRKIAELQGIVDDRMFPERKTSASREAVETEEPEVPESPEEEMREEAGEAGQAAAMMAGAV